MTDQSMTILTFILICHFSLALFVGPKRLPTFGTKQQKTLPLVRLPAGPTERPRPRPPVGRRPTAADPQRPRSNPRASVTSRDTTGGGRAMPCQASQKKTFGFLFSFWKWRITPIFWLFGYLVGTCCFVTISAPGFGALIGCDTPWVTKICWRSFYWPIQSRNFNTRSVLHPRCRSKAWSGRP